MVPFSPTATNCVPDQVTPRREFNVPELWDVHVIPSGEVRILFPVPINPTATNCEPDQVMPVRLVAGSDVRDVTGIPVTVTGI